MNRQIIGIYTLLLIILYVLFPNIIIAQNSQIENNLYLIKDEISGKYGGVDIYNEVIIPFEYDDLMARPYSMIINMNKYQRIRAKKNGQVGMINNYNQEIIPCKYNGVEYLGYGIYSISDFNDNHGLIDSLGNTILPCEYENIMEHEGRYLVVREERDCGYGIFDLASKSFALPCKYKNIYSALGTTDPYASAFWELTDNNDKISIVRTKDLKQITKYKYDNIEWGEVDNYGYHFSGGLAIVKRNGKYGAINEEGKEVVPVIFDRMSLELYQEDNSALLIATQKKQSGTIYTCYNVYGKQLFESSYRIHPLKSGGAFWGKRDDNGYYLYNYDGKRKSNTPYKSISETWDTYTIVNGNNGKGLISDSGTEIFPCQYEQIKMYRGKIIMLKTASGWQIYHLNKQKYLSRQYFETYDYDNHWNELEESVLFLKNGGWGILDIEKFEMVVPCIYDKVACTHHELYFCKNDKYGFANLNGDITELKYDRNKMSNSHFYLAKTHIENQKPDVDTNIPVNIGNLEQTFAVIIANEKYTETSIPDVPYASNDGVIFKEYCRKTLGIPSANIKYRENATLNQIRYELNWLKDISEAYNGDAKVIFYYAGHGIPDEKNSSAYLLPSDGFGSDINSAYSIDELYSQLGELPAKQITVFMDACFSGAKRDGDMLTSARSVAIKAKSGTPKGNMVVFSAAQGDETAYQYNKKKHGMFTYFLLKKLQETKGNATLGELETYVKQNVQQYSIRENNRKQTPTMLVSPELKEHISKLQIK